MRNAIGRNHLKKETTSDLVDFHCGGVYPGWIGIWSDGFCKGRKTGEPGQNPLSKARSSKTYRMHQTALHYVQYGTVLDCVITPKLK